MAAHLGLTGRPVVEPDTIALAAAAQRLAVKLTGIVEMQNSGMPCIGQSKSIASDLSHLDFDKHAMLSAMATEVADGASRVA